MIVAITKESQIKQHLEPASHFEDPPGDPGNVERHQQQINETLTGYGKSVALVALNIFDLCGQVEDWGLQSNQGDLVFGASNRLFLTETGWVASESHCNKWFLEEFAKRGFGTIR